MWASKTCNPSPPRMVNQIKLENNFEKYRRKHIRNYPALQVHAIDWFHSYFIGRYPCHIIATLLGWKNYLDQ